MTRAAAVFLGLMALGAASPALARGTGGERPGRALFERAEASFAEGRFADARADYQAAYDLEPLPALLFDIGQCYRNLGDYAEAQAYFQRYAELDPASPNRAATERLAVEMGRLDHEERARTGQPPIVVAPVPAPVVPAPALGPTVPGATTKPAPPVYRRAWFWVGIGGAIAAGAAVAFVSARDNRSATLAPIDAR